MKEEWLKDIWPQERDLMERPERLRYLRRALTQEETNCVFCEALEKGPSFDSLLLYKNKEAIVVLNKYPYNTGHLMVLPARHCGELTELSDSEYHAVSELLRTTVKIVKKLYGCSGMNLGLNQGRVAGAGIPDHMHWHIIPRWTGDTNFFPLIAETKVISETLEQSYNKYFEEFSKLSHG